VPQKPVNLGAGNKEDADEEEEKESNVILEHLFLKLYYRAFTTIEYEYNSSQSLQLTNFPTVFHFQITTIGIKKSLE